MSELARRHCRACEDELHPFSKEEAESLLHEEFSAWHINEMGTEISRIYRFKDYHETIAFVNAIAWIAHQEDHHPDLEISYSTCIIRYSTHVIGGLSENDFICAAKVDALLSILPEEET
jgi:4a-hydroxytetrahydrobiopterin dehydratase